MAVFLPAELRSGSGYQGMHEHSCNIAAQPAGHGTGRLRMPLWKLRSWQVLHGQAWLPAHGAP